MRRAQVVTSGRSRSDIGHCVAARRRRRLAAVNDMLQSCCRLGAAALPRLLSFRAQRRTAAEADRALRQARPEQLDFARHSREGGNDRNCSGASASDRASPSIPPTRHPDETSAANLPPPAPGAAGKRPRSPPIPRAATPAPTGSTTAPSSRSAPSASPRSCAGAFSMVAPACSSPPPMANGPVPRAGRGAPMASKSRSMPAASHASASTAMSASASRSTSPTPRSPATA